MEYLAGHTSYVRREPLGVCAAVTPWNYPMMMAVWKCAPALAAGTPGAQALGHHPGDQPADGRDHGRARPAGVFNVVCGDRDTGRALVVHPTPAMVSVTGRVGRDGGGRRRRGLLKRVHLELGGKAPVIVFDDADVGAAAEGIAGAGYFNAGQDCTAATRISPDPGCT